MGLNYSIIVNEELLPSFSILVALRNLAPTMEKKVFNVDLSTQQHLIMIVVCLLKNRSIKSRSYNVHKFFSISCRNAETLGCKFSPVRKKKVVCEEHPFSAQHSSPHMVPLWSGIISFGKVESPLAKSSEAWLPFHLALIYRAFLTKLSVYLLTQQTHRSTGQVQILLT